jgi:hypothetical protein
MKKITLLINILISSSSAWAGGFHMGLGNAVAKEGTKVFQEAHLINNVGDIVAQSLPSCGADAPYTVSPVAVSDIQGLDPLGHVGGYGHTFPTDHIYFYIQPVSTSAPTGTRVITNVYAPGDIHITSLISATYNGSLTDYGVEFYACREMKSYFSHVRSLSAELLNALNSANQNCTDYGSSGSSIHRCQAMTNIPVTAGTVVGTVGGSVVSLDFGSYDFRRTPIAFISPSRHYPNRLFTVCPVDYFVPAMKSTLEPHFGLWDGSYQRVTAPVCGEINFDQAGTAFGLWYKIGSPDQPEDPHLALIKDNVFNPRQSISNGTSVPGLTSMFYPFNPLSSGTYNRDFAQVTSDGLVYCYDSFFDPAGNPGGTGFGILITMPNSTTLRVEKLNTSCGAGPWAMGSSYGEFQR